MDPPQRPLGVHFENHSRIQSTVSASTSPVGILMFSTKPKMLGRIQPNVYKMMDNDIQNISVSWGGTAIKTQSWCWVWRSYSIAYIQDGRYQCRICVKVQKTDINWSTSIFQAAFPAKIPKHFFGSSISILRICCFSWSLRINHTCSGE